jgi:hypothetical protein
MNAVTNQELDAFYGVAPTTHEINSAIRDAVDNLDLDDLSDVVFANAGEVLAAVKDNDAFALMRVFQIVLKDTAARRASLALYDKVDALTPAHIDLGVGA